jgi:rare lipoprotein A
MRFYLIALVALLGLSACSSPELELASHIYKKNHMEDGYKPPPQEGNFKVGKPYKVDGKWYQPQETYSHTETGIASWYGPGFHGKRTANGEKFNRNELTAAHRTLQMPSLVRVTNLDSGRSVVVRINDRGPFKRSRVIDVSEKAAELLGFKGRGTAKVRLDLLADESKLLAMAARRGESTIGSEVAMNTRTQPQPLTSPQYQQVAMHSDPVVPGHVTNGQFLPDPVVSQMPVRPSNIYIQAGSYTQSANAQGMVQKLQSYGNTQVVPANVRGQQFLRVRIGPVASVDQADALLARLSSAGYKQAIIIVD